MPQPSVDPDTRQLLRRLAEATKFNFVSKQARSDLMARNLTRADVADAIVEWIDAGERVKPVVLHSFGGRVGQEAYEMKPRIGQSKFYVKVSIDDRDGANEGLALLSVHMDH